LIVATDTDDVDGRNNDDDDDDGDSDSDYNIGTYGMKSKLIHDDYQRTTSPVSEALISIIRRGSDYGVFALGEKKDQVSVTDLSHIQFLLDSFEHI